jgi:hypothetical protein
MLVMAVVGVQGAISTLINPGRFRRCATASR